MSVRAIAVLGLAIVCGASSALGVYLWRGRVVQVVAETVPVVVATAEIARGEVVSESKVAVRQWPRELAPQGVARELEAVVSRTALTPMFTAEPILTSKLADRDAGRGLAALIPDGRRAYTIQTSRVASNVAGFVMPGNRVDVLLTMRGGPDDNTGGGSSTTLLQAVEILAIDQHLDAPAENRVEPQQLRSVTLLVTPDQVSLLDLGQNMGTLALSLRNPADLAEAETNPATVNVLRFTERKPVAAAAKESSPGAWQWLSAAAAALPRAAMVSGLASAAAPPKRDVAEIQTFRGRHQGRVLIRHGP